MKPRRRFGIVILLVVLPQLILIECLGSKLSAGARKRSQRTAPVDSLEDEGSSSDEVDDDGRVYKNPRNLPSALCPRDEEQAMLLEQKCLRKCSSDEDCKSKKKKCLCDGACGMSCIKPERECKELTSPALGSVSVAGRLFGDRATYSCDLGFHLVGLRERTCRADGTWSGHPPACRQNVYCNSPPHIEHARHNALPEQTTFDLNTTLQYQCHRGYSTYGFSTAKCLDAVGSAADWFGPDITCEPRICGPPADVPHGWHAGKCFTYGCRVTYHCADGFELVGRPDRHCQADGTWSPKELPACVPVQCPPPENPNNGKAIYTSCSYNSVVSYECKYGYTLVGEPTRRCGADKRWSGVMPQCKAPCVVPRIQQSRVVLQSQSNNSIMLDSPQVVQHGEKLSVECEPNYEFITANSTPVECNNGTWTHIPRCEPVYCPFPGYIENGRVMLVGNMGVYDYRPYVRKVTNNKQIMYECERGFVLTDGPPGATCIGGRWSPKQLPRCVPGMHPRLRWSRSVRARRALLMAQNQRQQLWQRDRRRRNKKGRKAKKRGGKGKAGPCEVISEEPFLNIEVVKTGRDPNQTYSPGTVVRVSCGKGYGLNIGANVTAKCVRGQWKPAKPECLILPCRIPVTENGIYKLSLKEDGGQSSVLNGTSTVENGQVVEFSCPHGYNVQGPSNLRCWHGEWAGTSFPDCTAAPCELPLISNGQYLSGYRAGLTIANGSSVTFQCDSDYSKSTGQPIECILGELRPRVPACRHHTLPTITYNNGSSKHHETDVQFKGGSDITKGGDISVIDFPAGFRRACGPPARVQGSLVYRDGEPIGETDRSFPDGTEVTFNCIASIVGEKITWKIICEDGSWVGRSLNCEGEDVLDGVGILRNSTCVFRNTEPNLVSFYNDQQITEEVVEFPPGSLLVSRCIDIGKYSMIGSNHRRCVGGEWDGQKPVCFGLNQENDYALEKPPTILFRHQLGPIAQSNDGRLIVYPGTILHMECLWIRRFGTPKWVISHNYRKYPEGWTTDPGRDSQLEYRLSIYHASRDDSGMFQCMTPTRHTHAVEILVKAVHCPMIPPRRGLNLNTHNTKMNTKVLLSCANGNSLIGAPEITCLPSGNWSAPFPICESIECADLVNLTDPHLRVSILSREVGGRAVFSCAQGYGLRGPHEAVCQHTGDWASPLPTCQEVQCDTPRTPDNGYIQGNGPYKAGDVIQFNCNPEYMMEGQPIIACQENGRWSGTVPKCVQACSYPGTTISGRMSAVKFYYKIGETITFTCDEGLELRGAPMLRCLRNGKWSNAIPTCVNSTSTTVAATTTR